MPCKFDLGKKNIRNIFGVFSASISWRFCISTLVRRFDASRWVRVHRHSAPSCSRMSCTRFVLQSLTGSNKSTGAPLSFGTQFCLAFTDQPNLISFIQKRLFQCSNLRICYCLLLWKSDFFLAGPFSLLMWFILVKCLGQKKRPMAMWVFLCLQVNEKLSSCLSVVRCATTAWVLCFWIQMTRGEVTTIKISKLLL